MKAKSSKRLIVAALFFTVCCAVQFAYTAPSDAAAACHWCTVSGCKRAIVGAEDCIVTGPNPWDCAPVGNSCFNF